MEGRNLFGARHGPRFIREGEGDASGVPFSFLGFLLNVLGIIFLPSSSLAQATEAEAIAAAIAVFVLFNLLTGGLHALGSRTRKRLFYGRSLSEIVNDIYERHVWSQGQSYGLELKEKILLHRIFAANGEIDDIIRREIASFKAIADERQRLLFDICLCLAPFNPQRSLIINKAHDLLFFLPFLGPRMGRSSLIWPVQRAFQEREAYNAAVTRLAKGVSPTSATDTVALAFKKIIREYESAESAGLAAAGDNDYVELEGMVFSLLAEETNPCHLHFDFLCDQLPQINEVSQEFDRLDEYYPGDDIRRIDWKATARTATAKVLVRKYSCPYGIKIGFWMDLRFLIEKEGQQKWAGDFVRAIRMFHMLGDESILERLIFVMRDGAIQEELVNIRTHRDDFSTTQKILAKVREKMRLMAPEAGFQIKKGMRFYTQSENERFLRLVELSDFGGGIQNIRRVPLRAKRLNIFVIGQRENNSEEIEGIASRDNRIFTE